MDMKPSAYRSMVLAKGRKTKKQDGNLTRWIDEKWQNLTPKTLGDSKFYECGTKSPGQIAKNLPSVCRPTVKVSKSTPTLAQNYNVKQIKQAISIKKQGKQIQWAGLRT